MPFLDANEICEAKLRSMVHCASYIAAACVGRVHSHMCAAG